MSHSTDTPPQDRIWTPGRIAAVVAIAVVVVGLAYVNFKHPAGYAAVPDGARAGQLRLHSCTYPTEHGDVRADCGTLVVPENRADPKSRLIALPVTRIRARTPNRAAEPVFRLEGGPGRTNMDFPFAARYSGRRDLVLVGYRGVDGSARLDCPEVDDARRYTGDLLSAGAQRATARAFRACADRLRSDGYDLRGYTLAQRADDLDAARRALGYRRVDLLSESFGTRVALVYAWRHPRSIHRSVMIGANPPGHFVWNPQRTGAQLHRFAALGSGDPAVADPPKRWGPFPIHRGNVEVASFFGLMESSSKAAPISAPMTLEAWRAAAKGDASGLWFQSFASGLLFPRIEVWGDAAAMGRIDSTVAARHFAGERRGDTGVGDAGNRFLWADGALARAWPAAPDERLYSSMRDSAVPTLVISGELDGTTPAVNATRELLPHLPNGRQVILPGFGHTTDFWNNQVAAGNRLVNTYLASGRVDDSRYVAQKVDFSPPLRQTTLAKIALAAMAGLALVSLLSLVGLARRVRRRGRLGRVTRVVTRSAGALVIGLGGWFAAPHLAQGARPSLPLDAALLLVAAMGVAVALASWLGWRGPERSATAATGLAAALAGALVGAFLGLQCGRAALALLTTLVGAVAGANLALIGCDVASETLAAGAAQPASSATAASTSALATR